MDACTCLYLSTCVSFVNINNNHVLFPFTTRHIWHLMIIVLIYVYQTNPDTSFYHIWPVHRNQYNRDCWLPPNLKWFQDTRIKTRCIHPDIFIWNLQYHFGVIVPNLYFFGKYSNIVVHACRGDIVKLFFSPESIRPLNMVDRAQ